MTNITYVRTKNGIYECEQDSHGTYYYYIVVDFMDIPEEEIISKSFNLYELIQLGDLVRITKEASGHFDLYDLLEVTPSILQLIQNDLEWGEDEFISDIIEFYIKDGNNFKLAATKTSDQGELKLI